MTVTYDPAHPNYFDEADMRGELERVYDLCQGCRLCLHLCPSFPSLFNAIDGHDGDVGAMTIAEQDKVVDECYGCKICYVKCPYVPPHEWELDFPRLMLRANAVRVNNNEVPIVQKLANQILGRTDLIGTLNSAVAPLANKMVGTPGTLARKAIEKSVGVASQRVLPAYSKVRFSKWFKRRQPKQLTAPQAKVAIFPTCFVEYMEPVIGQDTVKVLEHNNVACSLPDGVGCCGAPWLHSGEVEKFVAQAKKNIPKLAAVVAAGNDIVVPQPTCSYVLKQDYPIYAPGPEAESVSAHTYDTAEYYIKLHKDDATSIDREFVGNVPETTTYHVPCHLQAQNIGLKSRDAIKLTGTKINLVNKCSGIDGTWGLRAENYELARKVAAPLGEAITKANSEVIVGDCHLANGAIKQETGENAIHPMTYLARAYGLTEEDSK